MPITCNWSLPRTRSGFRLSPHNAGAVASAFASLMVIFVSIASPRPALGQTAAEEYPAAALMHELIVGIASMYNPCDSAMFAEDAETASGEVCDAEAWTAAIQIDLRDRFSGVHYGRNYRRAYALVENKDKRVIVKINDVGPLAPGRVIDLTEQTMRYFDPTLELGLIPDVRITPLTGDDWTPGPVANMELFDTVAARQNRPRRDQLAGN